MVGRTSSAYFKSGREERILDIIEYQEYLYDAISHMLAEALDEVKADQGLPREKLDAIQVFNRLLRKELHMATAHGAGMEHRGDDSHPMTGDHGPHEHEHADGTVHSHSHPHTGELPADHDSEEHMRLHAERHAMTGHGVEGRAGKPGSWGPRATRARQEAIRAQADDLYLGR